MREMLDGKAAVVTGGASGLGRATVELFAEHGAKVVVADVHDARGAETVAAVEASGGAAIYVRTDVTVSADVRAVVQAAEDTYGQLDIMVANAGIAGSQAALADLDEDEFRTVLDINFYGVWRSFKYAIPAIRRAGGGSMTSTSSLSGVHTVAGIKRGSYSAAKRAVNMMTSYLSSELSADLIRVNAVAAGGMSTNITESFGSVADPAGPPPPAKPRNLRPFGESPYPICDPREVAQVHLFLNSPLASFVNGQVLVADAGGFATTVAAYMSVMLGAKPPAG